MKKRYAILIGVLAIMLVGTVSAATITAHNRRLEAMLGGRIDVSNSILISDEGNGFVTMHNNVSGIGTSPTDPVYFNATKILNLATTQLTAGDWVYDVRLTSTASTPPNSVFEVRFRGLGGFYQPKLYVATGPTVEPNVTIICLFEFGPTLNTPYAYTVTVEKISP